MKTLNPPSTLIKRLTISGTKTTSVNAPIFEEKKFNNLKIGYLSSNYAETQAAITSIACTATTIDLKSGDKFTIGGQSFTVNADAAAGATSLTVSSITLTMTLREGMSIELDKTNLFVQYQRKSEGTIGGFTIDANTITAATGANWDSRTGEISGVDTEYIKLIPRDFVQNDDASGSNLAFKDGTSNAGITIEDADLEVYAFAAIPYNKRCITVDIWGNNTKVVKVFELDVNANGLGSALATGAVGTSITGLTIDSTSTNYLAIRVTLTSTSNFVYGGKITLTEIP